MLTEFALRFGKRFSYSKDKPMLREREHCSTHILKMLIIELAILAVLQGGNTWKYEKEY